MSSSITKDQIIATESSLLNAMKSSNIEALDKLLHDDLLFIAPNGQTFTKAMDLEAHQSGTIVINEIVATIELIHLIENTAIVTLVIDTKGKLAEQEMEGKFRYIRVWRLFNDMWKVIAGSCTKL